MAIWVLSGTRENWEIGLEKKVWGVGEKARGLWNKLEPGDKVLFYATKTGFLGEGIILDKYVEEKPIWPEEKTKKKSFKYRIKIKVKKIYANPKPKPKNFRKVAFAINPVTEREYKQITR